MTRAGFLAIVGKPNARMSTLLNRLVGQNVPESRYLYPEDEVSTQSVRFFFGEMIRETTLELLHKEIPYGIACELEEYREGRSPLFIRAVIYVERESQKGMLVGAGGSMIKKIGENSRKKIESFVGEAVYLELQVKVIENWRKKAGSLQRIGYYMGKGERNESIAAVARNSGLSQMQRTPRIQGRQILVRLCGVQAAISGSR